MMQLVLLTSVHFAATIMDLSFISYFSSQDYAIETPLKKSSAVVEGDLYYELKIDFSTDTDIAAINFVLKVCF